MDAKQVHSVAIAYQRQDAATGTSTSQNLSFTGPGVTAFEEAEKALAELKAKATAQ